MINSSTRALLNRVFISSIVFLIGLYCIFSSYFGADFACLHIFIDEIKLPVFVGEFLFGFCLMITLIQLRLIGKPDAVDVFSACFFCFIVLLAIIGYTQGGFLAFRNAAMLYYALFAWFAYRCYSKSFFSASPVLYTLIAFDFLILLNGKFSTYYWLTYILLLNVLTIKTNKKWLIISGVILSAYQIGLLFVASRSHFVASVLSFVLITFLACRYFLSMSKRIIISCLALFVVVGMYYCADRNAIKSLVDVQAILTRYKFEQAKIEAKSERFVPERLRVALYRSEELHPRQNIFNFGRKTSVVKVGDVESVYEIHDLQPSIDDGEKSIKEKRPHGVENINLYKETSAIENPQLGNMQTLDSIRIEAGDKNGLASKTEVHNLNRKSYRDLGIANTNILFRYFIWRDMIHEWMSSPSNFLVGVGLGKPQRSSSIEKLKWGFIEWRGVGWITPHNYFLHLIYRLGLMGVILIGLLIFSFIKLTKTFVIHKDFCGLLLIGILFYWIIVAQFLVILELPYYAIVFWSLYGIVLAYARDMIEVKH